MDDKFNTVKQSGKVCARCSIVFDKGGEMCDLCDDRGADVSKLQNIEQEEHDSSHEADGASALNVIEKVNRSLQPIGESPLMKK
jgi:recombinational DNA repair protein RecR